MKKAILLVLMLTGSAFAGLWQDQWHDAEGDLWIFRRQLNVSTESVTGFSNELTEVEITFAGVKPYCDDFNTDSDLKDNDTDFVSIRLVNQTYGGTFNDTVFEVESYSCTSNKLDSATIRFRADVAGTAEDYGWGKRSALYWLYFTNESRKLITEESTLAAPSGTVITTSGMEQRKLRETRLSWDGVPFRWRLCYTFSGSSDWRFNTTMRELISFSGVRPYCEDTNSNGWIEAGEGGTIRLVEEFNDGTYAEIPMIVDGGICSNNKLAMSYLTAIHDIPASSKDIGFGNGVNRLWFYYDNYTSTYQTYPAIYNQTPEGFSFNLCASEDGPGCPSQDWSFNPGVCCQGQHFWDLDDSPSCSSLCESLGYNASLQCCGDEPNEYFLGLDWACVDGYACKMVVDEDGDRAEFGDTDDTCNCSADGSDDGKACDAGGTGEWNGFCASDECVTCSNSLDFLCPNINCMGIDPDCCDKNNPCIAGMICNQTLGRCIAPVGKLCLQNSDCLADTVCKTNVCVAKKFAYLQYGELGAKLGEQTVVPLSVRDPQGRSATYGLAFGGDAQYFAKFYGRSGNAEITLNPGESKEIPVYLIGGQSGDFTLEILVYDKASLVDGIPEIYDTEELTFHVRGDSGITTSITAPGLNVTDLLSLSILSMVIFWIKKKS